MKSFDEGSRGRLVRTLERVANRGGEEARMRAALALVALEEGAGWREIAELVAPGAAGTPAGRPAAAAGIGAADTKAQTSEPPGRAD